MEKVNQRVAVSKYLLKEGLLRLLKKKHISRISVSELCQEAGINRTTFYRHYTAPRDVLQEFAMDQVRGFADQTVDGQNMQDVREFVLRLCAFLYARVDMVRMFIQNDTEMDFMGIFQTLSQDFLGARTILYRGRTMDEDTLRLTNTFFYSGMSALIRLWLTEDMDKTPEEIADLITGAFSRDVVLR